MKMEVCSEWNWRVTHQSLGFWQSGWCAKARPWPWLRHTHFAVYVVACIAFSERSFRVAAHLVAMATPAIAQQQLAATPRFPLPRHSLPRTPRTTTATFPCVQFPTSHSHHRLVVNAVSASQDQAAAGFTRYRQISPNSSRNSLFVFLNLGSICSNAPFWGAENLILDFSVRHVLGVELVGKFSWVLSSGDFLSIRPARIVLESMSIPWLKTNPILVWLLRVQEFFPFGCLNLGSICSNAPFSSSWGAENLVLDFSVRPILGVEVPGKFSLVGVIFLSIRPGPIVAETMSIPSLKRNSGIVKSCQVE